MCFAVKVKGKEEGKEEGRQSRKHSRHDLLIDVLESTLVVSHYFPQSFITPRNCDHSSLS
jgi:hypothetical protein